MEFVQKFTPLDFQVKNFTPSILPNFNSFSKKKTQKMSENGEIYTAGKNFTLPPALTAWTNSTSAQFMTRQNFSFKGASTMGNVAQTGTTSKRVLLIYRF